MDNRKKQRTQQLVKYRGVYSMSQTLKETRDSPLTIIQGKAWTYLYRCLFETTGELALDLIWQIQRHDNFSLLCTKISFIFASTTKQTNPRINPLVKNGQEKPPVRQLWSKTTTLTSNWLKTFHERLFLNADKSPLLSHKIWRQTERKWKPIAAVDWFLRVHKAIVMVWKYSSLVCITWNTWVNTAFTFCASVAVEWSAKITVKAPNEHSTILV